MLDVLYPCSTTTTTTITTNNNGNNYCDNWPSKCTHTNTTKLNKDWYEH